MNVLHILPTFIITLVAVVFMSSRNRAQQKQAVSDVLMAQPFQEIRRMVQDHRRLYRLMLTHFPNRPTAIVALHQSVREGITKDIAQYTSLSPVVAERFARRLSEQTGLSMEWSLWSVQTWSNAVGVQANIRQRSAAAEAVKRVSRPLLHRHKSNVVELQGHRKTITDIAFSPNGRWVATASMDRSIRLWDVKSGNQLARFLAGHRDWIRSIAFQPDGTRLISGGDDGAIRLWDLQKGRRLQRFVAHQGWVLDVAFSHDGSLFASAGRDGMVLIWSTESLEIISRIGPFGKPVQEVSFSYTGESISIALPGLIEVWNLQDNQRRLRRITRGERLGVLMLPDGGVLVSSREGLNVLRPDNPEEQLSFHGHQGDVWGTVLDPVSPTIASYGTDRNVRFWDGRDGSSLWKMEMKTDINAVSLSRDGRLAIALSSSKAWVWEMERSQ